MLRTLPGVLRTGGILLARKPWRLRSAALRARADTLRRARDFAGAIPLYRQYLQWRPDHATAWMLFGHCLKECGHLAEAEHAYAEAVRLAPANREAVVARAHFLKTTGRRRDAHAAFAAAIALGAGDEAEREMLNLHSPGLNPSADATPGSARIWIDLADLLIFLNHNRYVSGIQRVQMALLDHALAHPAGACCVLTQPWDTRIWCLSPTLLRALRAGFEEGGGGTPQMRALIHRLLDGAAETPPAPGRVLFKPGAFWIGGGNPPLAWAARSAGMRVAPLLHDIIPVRNPEVCIPELVHEFTWALGEELRGVDAIIANSAHTAGDVAALMAEHGMDPCPIIAVPLAHRLSEAPPAQPQWTPQIERLRGTLFVFTVGTIEPRKNHILLLRVWQALVAEGVDMPTLVIAGKRGWLTQTFDAEMAASGGVGGRVLTLADLSDAELDTLYAHCLFTAFPSLAEGWGLPVGESLARGKICVASNRDSMPEVGGDFAFYVDPEDVPAALPVFRHLITEPGALAAAEARLRQGFSPRGWPEVVVAMMAALGGLDAAAHPPRPPLLRAGEEFRPGPINHREGPAGPFGPPLRMMLAEGWMAPRPEGAAMASTRAPLHLRVGAAGLLRLELRAAEPMVLRIAGREWPLDGAAVVEVPVGPGDADVVLEIIGGAPARNPSLPPGLWLLGVRL